MRFLVVSLLSLLLSTGPALAQRNVSDNARSSGQKTQSGESETDMQVPKDADMLRQIVLPELFGWRHAKARQVLEASEEKLGTSPDFKTAWGILLAEEKKLDKAIQSLSKASTADPDDPTAPYYLGEVYSWQRKKDKATSEWKKAQGRAEKTLQKNPEDPQANYWLGATLLKLGKISQARSALQKSSTGGFQPAMTDFQFGLVFSAQKNWTKAKEHFDRCLRTDNSLAHAYYYRGRVLEKLGKKSEMLTDLNDAREASVARALLGDGG